MTDGLPQRAPNRQAAVALPKIPPWSAPTPASIAKAAEAKRVREEAAARNNSAARAGGAQSVSGSGTGSNGKENGSLRVSWEKLAGMVGTRVKLTNTLSRTFTGTIYSCSPSELVLSTGATEYHLIPVSKIRGYEVVEQAAVDGALRDREREERDKAKAEEREKRLVRPKDVSSVGWAVFLLLEKTLPVRWNDKKIVVLDNVTIEPPYDVEDCKAPAKYGKQLERVKGLVRTEREKVAGRRGG